MITVNEVWDRLRGKLIYTDTDCWIPSYSADNDGYTHMKFNGEMRAVHSVVYEAVYGKRFYQEDGVEIDHLCRNRSCCNPLHLDITTRMGNIIRSPLHNKNKKHCPQNHPYDDENTYIDGSGYRHCKTCRKVHKQKYQEKLRRY